MREIAVFLKYVVVAQLCRFTAHRWLDLPTDPFPPVLWDRVCTRCYTRDTRKQGDYLPGGSHGS
jgi:hypothetical protein